MSDNPILQNNEPNSVPMTPLNAPQTRPMAALKPAAFQSKTVIKDMKQFEKFFKDKPRNENLFMLFTEGIAMKICNESKRFMQRIKKKMKESR